MITEFDRSRYNPAYLQSCVSEAAVQKEVLAELARRGIMAFAVDAGAARLRGRAYAAIKAAGGNTGAIHGAAGGSTAGLPDIIGVMPGGRALFIEVKAPEWREWKDCGHTIAPRCYACHETIQTRPAGKLKPEQRQFLERAAAMGAVAGVCWHWKDLENIFK